MFTKRATQGLLLLGLLLLMTSPAFAQSEPSPCPAGLPADFEVDRWVMPINGPLPVYAVAGFDASTRHTLEPGHGVSLQSGPYCLDNVDWWEVNDYEGISGWMPAQIIGEITLQRYLLTLPEPEALGIAMRPPVISTPEVPVPAVTPKTITEIPNIGYVPWEWTGEYPDPAQITLPEAYAGNLPVPPVDLDTVHFVTDVGLTTTQLELLAQNGFVVVPSDETQFDSAYRFRDEWDSDDGKGMFITTDALLHTLFISYQYTLQYLEIGQFYNRLIDVIAQGYTAAEAQWQAAIGTPMEEAAYKATLYYAVPMLLLADARGEIPPADAETDPYSWQIDYAPLTQLVSVLDSADPAIIEAVQPIAEMIRSAEGMGAIPFLDQYTEDFTQYKVRSYYTASPMQQTYFRTMMWLGRITFTTRSDADTRTGLMVLRALSSTEAQNAHSDIAETLDFLVGPMDDFGPADYTPLIEAVYGADASLENYADENLLTAFKAQVAQLPGPRINSIILPVATSAEDVDELTRGFRLFGQRFTLDGYIMQQLIYPEVGTNSQSRLLPLGLDVPAALGSDVAFVLADEAGATEFTNYTENMGALRTEIDDLTVDDWFENLYGGWLFALQPLLVRDPATVPPMMQTDAWKRKDLQTTLGSWTELKHATILYAEQPMGGLGGGGYVPPVISESVIEPNPEVFARIAIIASTLRRGLMDRGLMDDAPYGSPMVSIRDALGQLANLSARLAEFARLELAGESVPYWDQYYLQQSFAQSLDYIRYTIEIWVTDPPETIALATDVASNPLAGIALQVAIGDVDFIYVITDGPYGYQLTRGAVYSYYEFENDINNRLTDEQWREMLATGQAPARPEWINLFYAEP